MTTIETQLAEKWIKELEALGVENYPRLKYLLEGMVFQDSQPEPDEKDDEHLDEYLAGQGIPPDFSDA